MGEARPLLSPHTPQGLGLARQESAHRNSLSLHADLLAPLWSLRPLPTGSTPHRATSSLGVLPQGRTLGLLVHCRPSPQTGCASVGPSLGLGLVTQYSLGQWGAWGPVKEETPPAFSIFLLRMLVADMSCPLKGRESGPASRPPYWTVSLSLSSLLSSDPRSLWEHCLVLLPVCCA